MITTINQLKGMQNCIPQSAKPHVAACLESAATISELHDLALCRFSETGKLQAVYLSEHDVMLTVWLAMQEAFCQLVGQHAEALQFIEVLEPHSVEWYSGMDDRFLACELYGNGNLHGVSQIAEVWQLARPMATQESEEADYDAATAHCESIARTMAEFDKAMDTGEYDY